MRVVKFGSFLVAYGIKDGNLLFRVVLAEPDDTIGLIDHFKEFF